MSDDGPEGAFRGLPLSAEQQSEIRHYIHQRARRGLPPDPVEVQSMLRDMLEPPALDSFAAGDDARGALADAERAASRVDPHGDAIADGEERAAAREAEAMKHSPD